MKRQQFKDFDATELFCPRCRRAVPVRKRLLLVLSEGEKTTIPASFVELPPGTKS